MLQNGRDRGKQGSRGVFKVPSLLSLEQKQGFLQELVSFDCGGKLPRTKHSPFLGKVHGLPGLTSCCGRLEAENRGKDRRGWEERRAPVPQGTGVSKERASEVFGAASGRHAFDPVREP